MVSVALVYVHIIGTMGTCSTSGYCIKYYLTNRAPPVKSGNVVYSILHCHLHTYFPTLYLLTLSPSLPPLACLCTATCIAVPHYINPHFTLKNIIHVTYLRTRTTLFHHPFTHTQASLQAGQVRDKTPKATNQRS